MLRNATAESWSKHTTPELTAAVLDEMRDPREPVDADHGDRARRFALDLRLQLMREHLNRAADEDTDLLDPDAAVSALQASATVLDDWYRWYRSGCTTPRPPGHLRTHVPPPDSPVRRRLAPSVYNLVFDPDGRPLRVRLRRTH